LLKSGETVMEKGKVKIRYSYAVIKDSKILSSLCLLNIRSLFLECGLNGDTVNYYKRLK
jgi:hypothetical protein